MHEQMKTATAGLWQIIGQDKQMVLATSDNTAVAARTVNVYTADESLYFVTESDSNKYAQISDNNRVALSIGAIQISGNASLLEHPSNKANKPVIDIIEKQLPHHFDRYHSVPMMRLIKITPSRANYLSLETGEGYAINFINHTAIPLKHEM